MSFGKLALFSARLGVLLGVTFLLLLVSYTRLSGQFPPLGVFLYGARLSWIVSSGLFAVWTLLCTIETQAARGKLLSTGAALLVLFPAAHTIAAHIAASDGLRARGVQAWHAQVGLTLGLCALVAFSWSYHFWARRRVLDLLCGAALVAALLGAEVRLGRAQTELATLLQVLAIYLGAQLIAIVLAERARALLGIAIVSAGLSAVLGVVGLLLPDPYADGQRRALTAESSIAHLHARLLTPARALRAAPPRCADLRSAPAWPVFERPADQRRNVIIISIDTLRADYVSRRVAGQPLMPELAQFIGESRYAAEAQSAFPATLLAMSAAFTGAMPTDLLLSPRPTRSVFSLARAHFDHVEAVLPEGRYFSRPDVKEYLLRGLDVSALAGARAQTRHAIARLRELRAENKRHLLWLHYFEPHGTYDKHADLDFGDSDAQRYQSELAYVDAQLGRLLRVLGAEGWYEDSLILLFSDHGESFGEHDHFYHHYLLYPWLVKVPLVVHAPGLTAGVITAPVHLMDVAATILQFLGQAPERPMRGLPLLVSDPPRERILMSEEISISGRNLLALRNAPARSHAELVERLHTIERGPGYAAKLAVTRGSLHLIEQRASGAVELYDTLRDPRAEHDLAQRLPEQTKLLSREAERFREDAFTRALCELPVR